MLYKIAGFTTPPPLELEDDQAEQLIAILVIHATKAIAAGVVLNLEGWAALDTRERAAWGTAARRVHVERACEFIAAQRDELRAAELYAEIDGGDVHDDIMMDRVMHVAMLSMPGGG